MATLISPIFAGAPDFLKGYKPIIISSPTVRAGTTLLQRLLCSAPDTLIYGEPCGTEMQIFLNFYLSKALFYAHGQGMRDDILHQVLKGEVNDWITDLMPDMTAYHRELGLACFSMFRFYRDYAVKQGRPAWGFKVAGWGWQQIAPFKQVMPGAKVIYIVRDLIGCLKSARAVDMVSGIEDVHQMAVLWKHNLESLLAQGENPDVLLLEYHDLLDNPGPVLEVLAGFTGSDRIDASVLTRRINTRVGQDERSPGNDGFITPAELSEEEITLAREISSPLWNDFKSSIIVNRKGGVNA